MNAAPFKIRGCHWIDVPGAQDERGRLNFMEQGRGLDFAPARLFWLHHVRPGQWRGRHGHRRCRLVLVAMAGRCRIHLDDGTVRQAATLDDPARALHVGPLVWHELTDFDPGASVLVIASTPFDEADYLRDYEQFCREARQLRP